MPKSGKLAKAKPKAVARRRRKRASAPLSLWTPAWYGLYGSVPEPFTGAWQRNITEDISSNPLQFSAVYACITGIASDIAKLRIKLVKKDGEIWSEVTESSPYLPVLREPNEYQTSIQFVCSWMLSKLMYGNTYVGLERDNRGGPGSGIVNGMHVLNPARVKPLIADNGSVFYELQIDELSEIREVVTVPASEIIHDRMNPLWHRLIGVSPLYACAQSVQMGNRIQDNSTQFFANRSMPGGMLTAPGKITNETAERMKAKFEDGFSGRNLGRLFVAGDGIKFDGFNMMTAEQSELIKQLEFSVSDVARAFRYPLFKLTGQTPPYAGSTQALSMLYYVDCLQAHIEDIEACLNKGLSLASNMSTELDVDNLLRMDSKSLLETIAAGVGAGVLAPNEGRAQISKPPVEGGDTPYLQEQNYSLAALNKRDSGDDPFRENTAASTPAAQSEPEEERALTAQEVDLFEAELKRELVTQ